MLSYSHARTHTQAYTCTHAHTHTQASWVSFIPAVSNYGSGYQLHNFNRSGLVNAVVTTDPVHVVTHGGVHLHSLGPTGSVFYSGADYRRLEIRSLDVPIVSAGLLSPFPTPGVNDTIGQNLRHGWHYNLQNNIWNVNYPQWYPFVSSDADARFRFQVGLPVNTPRTRHLTPLGICWISDWLSAIICAF